MLNVKKQFFALKKSEFVKNIFTLMSGNIIGYAVNLVLLPVISRVYTTSELGGYDLIISSANIFLTVLQLSLMFVIMIPKEDETANIISKIILGFTVVGSLVSILVLWWIQSKFMLFKTDLSYAWNLVLFASYLILYNLQAICYSYSNRKKLYSVLFWNPIITAVVNGGLSVTMGIIGAGTVGYMVATLFSYIVAVFHMCRYIHPFRGHYKLSDYKRILCEYKSYPLVQMPASIVSSVALQMPAQFLGRMFSTAVLGGYSMACKILSVPVSLLATPVNRVYYRTLVEKLEKAEHAGEFAFLMLKKTIQFAMIPIGVLMIFGDLLTSFILGKEWEVTGVYILILGIVFLLKYCSSCMSGTFVATHDHKLSMGYSIFSLLMHFGCFFLAYALHMEVMQTIILYAVFTSVDELVKLFLCMHCLGVSTVRYLGFVVKYILSGAALIYALYAVRIWLFARFL